MKRLLYQLFAMMLTLFCFSAMAEDVQLPSTIPGWKISLTEWIKVFNTGLSIDGIDPILFTEGNYEMENYSVFDNYVFEPSLYYAELMLVTNHDDIDSLLAAELSCKFSMADPVSTRELDASCQSGLKWMIAASDQSLQSNEIDHIIRALSPSFHDTSMYDTIYEYHDNIYGVYSSMALITVRVMSKSTGEICYSTEHYDSDEIIHIPEYDSSIPTDSELAALGKANAYLSSLTFSEIALKEKLESDGLADKDIRYALEKCGIDWNQQALDKANEYMTLISPVREQLIELLTKAGFTDNQIAYATEHCDFD